MTSEKVEFPQSWMVPLAGNAFITTWHEDESDEDHSEVITECGLGNWISPHAVCSVYFYVCQPGSLTVGLRLSVPNQGTSRIKVILDEPGNPAFQGYKLDIKGETPHVVPVGTFNVTKSGYVKLDLQGVRKTGDYFGDVHSAFVLTRGEIRYVVDDFYFGRRGPSVHLSYQTPGSCKCTEYFYNEITVPTGQDVLGAYFCAAGFRGGYFGIQVNSSTERRVLFSVWSAWNTDNPEEIPEDYKVTLERKGPDVHVGEFGNEGSGAQSYLKFNWKANNKYKFLIYGAPMDENHTLFTAWFYAPELDKWRLIASFKKPKESIYLTNPYSFSENFYPGTGHIERKALYGNQWARDSSGIWHELTIAKFTGDATSKKNRLDFAGGLDETGHFYLRNCGFFSDRIETGQEFFREPTHLIPDIDFHLLP